MLGLRAAEELAERDPGCTHEPRSAGGSPVGSGGGGGGVPSVAGTAYVRDVRAVRGPLRELVRGRPAGAEDEVACISPRIGVDEVLGLVDAPLRRQPATGARAPPGA